MRRAAEVARATGSANPPTQPADELWIALAIVAGITAGYGLVASNGVPAASGLFGHGLGVVGFLLMLATETLYSLRKRARDWAWGPLYRWLQAHIVMGIVGPYLVLLHSSWRFGGLAGALTLLTAIVVLSGFVGRYLYTAIPRAADAVADGTADAAQRLARRRLARWHIVHVPLGLALFVLAFIHIGAALYYATLLR